MTHGFDDGRNIRVRLAQECLARWSLPGWSERGMSLIIGATHEDGHEQAVADGPC
jgi:hypothetical protein